VSAIFATFDNCYADGDVSQDGHSWANAAYATDQNEKSWPANYGGHSQAQNRSLSGLDNAFVSKLNPDGSALIWSTYFGGSADDGGSGIAVDSAGSVYFAGRTSSSDFPVQNALQTKFGGSPQDAFVVKLAQVLPPLMQITRSGNTVLITWPTAATGFGFEVSDTLALAPNWSSATNTPVVVGDQNVVAVEALSSTKFFRLKKAQ